MKGKPLGTRSDNKPKTKKQDSSPVSGSRRNAAEEIKQLKLDRVRLAAVISDVITIIEINENEGRRTDRLDLYEILLSSGIKGIRP